MIYFTRDLENSTTLDLPEHEAMSQNISKLLQNI